ncbi:MAG: YggS family pyridoxal phosphate-dependent enzyme [Leptospira sp.]|nr:YggS family pyridoxal phosphate-dependent enzyme [Leptospira sp.]
MSIRENFDRISEEIRKLRPEKPPEIIVVSKKQSLAAIEEAIGSGITLFGENQIKEGNEKFSELKNKNIQFELHHIGPVQSGSVKKLFDLFSCTHGVCSESGLFELKKQSDKHKKRFGFFLETNLTGENSKSGFSRKELSDLLKNPDSLGSEFCDFRGLMTMGPSDGDPAMTRNVFRDLRKIREEFAPNAKLSMGMSGDYLIATEEGSDYLRIGTAIFGERKVE